MKKIPTIIKKGKIVYVLYPENVVVFVGLGQWVTYNKYNNWNRQGIARLRNAILKSKDTDYTTPSSLLELAHECGVVGAGTSRPTGLEL